MGKYDPLRDYLRKLKTDEVELSFAEMERKIGYMLPKSASLPQWWATQPTRPRPTFNARLGATPASTPF